MIKKIPLILIIISVGTLGLTLTQAYWLWRDYRYYSTQKNYVRLRNDGKSKSIERHLGEQGSSPELSELQHLSRRGTVALPPAIVPAPLDDSTATASISRAPNNGNIRPQLAPLANSHYINYMPLAPSAYLLKKIKWQLAYSLVLILITTGGLVFMLKTIFSQRILSGRKSEFIETLMHELRTPLATAQVAIEALKKYGVLADQFKTQRYLDISVFELAHLSTLIDRILDQSILNSGKMTLQRNTVDINRLIDSLMYKYIMSTPHLDIVFERKPGPLYLYVDAIHLSNAIGNLIENAIKYSFENKKIVLTSRMEKSNWIFKIEDNGIGIDKRYQKKVFGRFFRVKDAQVKSKGFGLGLSYVSKVITLHGGTVKVDSNDGGSTFTVKLPTHE